MNTDYYKILGISRHASLHEVKKAYRQLALKYHPDVSGGGKATESWFRQISEAYQILSHPAKRATYDQERWYRESMISGKAQPAQTPDQLLLKMHALAQYTQKIDPFNLNADLLRDYLLYLLDEPAIGMLLEFKYGMANRHIAEAALKAAGHLNYVRFVPVATKIMSFSPDDIPAIQNILDHKKRGAHWQRYQLIYVLLTAVLLCLLIFLFA